MQHSGKRSRIWFVICRLKFAEDVAHPAGLLRLDAVEKNGEMIGKDGAFRAAPARVMRHGNQISPVPVAALDRDGVQGPEGGRQIKMAAPETGVELLAARVDAGRFRPGERDEAVMVAARAGPGSGRQQGEERLACRTHCSHFTEPCASFTLGHQPTAPQPSAWD